MPMPSRRRVLQAATTLLALPSLESFGFRRFARAASAAARPKRMVCLGIGYGVTEETWFPKKDDIGAGYTLTEGLDSLNQDAHHIAISYALDFLACVTCYNDFGEDLLYFLRDYTGFSWTTV